MLEHVAVDEMTAACDQLGESTACCISGNCDSWVSVGSSDDLILPY